MSHLPLYKNNYWGYFPFYFLDHDVSFHVNLCNQGNVWQIRNKGYLRICSIWLLLHGLLKRAWAWVWSWGLPFTNTVALGDFINSLEGLVTCNMGLRTWLMGCRGMKRALCRAPGSAWLCFICRRRSGTLIVKVNLTSSYGNFCTSLKDVSMKCTL